MLLNPYLATVGVGGAAVTYFFEERFEGTGYENTWSEAGSTGTVDEDWTTSPLDGSQSLKVAVTAGGQVPATVAVLPSDQAELWAFFMFRIDTAVNATRLVFTFRNSSGTTVGGVGITSANLFVVQAGATQSAGTTDAMTTGTNYNIWCHYIKGTGANAVMNGGFSTTGTEPTSGNAFKSVTIGNATTDAHDLKVGMIAAPTTCALIFDKILISTTGTIGDSPA